MQIGVIGLDAVGAHIVRCLLAAEHQCVVFDASPFRVAELAAEKAYGAASVPDLAHELDPPRVIWLTGDPAYAIDAFKSLQPSLTAGDLIVDTTAGDHADHVHRARDLAAAGIDYVQVAIVGGVDDRPVRCVLISGDEEVLERVGPLLRQVRTFSEMLCAHGMATTK